MKLRTLGRHHCILHHLCDGKLKRRAELGKGIGGMDAHALQALLERGLVERVPRNIKQRGWYVITDAGKKAYDILQDKQSWIENMPAGITNRHWYNEDYEELIVYPSDHNIAHRGYRWMEVQCPMSSYWIEHFKTHIW